MLDPAFELPIYATALYSFFAWNFVIVFSFLKLTGYVEASWIWGFAPFWVVPITIVLGTSLFLFVSIIIQGIKNL